MRLGVLLIPTDPWPVAVARARAIEDMGFAHLWTYDHLSWQRYRDEPWFGAVPWLSGIAMATSTIRLGTMVTSPNFREPVLLAKDVMTLDHISGGRITLGAGAGGTGFDADVLGQPALTPRERAARFHDFARMLDALLRNTSYTGSTPSYRAVEARTIPGCVQQPRVPLAIAAGGPTTMRTAAEFAEAWITFGDPRDPNPTVESMSASARRQRELLDEACQRVGRDVPGRIFLAGSAAGRPLASREAFARLYEWCQTEGFTDLVLHDPRAGDSEWNDDPAVLEWVAQTYC